MLVKRIYEYAITLKRCIDGDTVEGDIDLGCNVWLNNQRFRLYRINAPEKHGATAQVGLEAKAYLESLVARYGAHLLCRTHKGTAEHDSFGRWLVELLGEDEQGVQCNLNDQMLSSGHAVEFMP